MSDGPAGSTTTRGNAVAAHPVLVVMVLGFSSLCASLTQSLVIPIQPDLPAILSTTAGNAAWVVTATLMGGAVAMPVAGRLADTKGKKPVLVASGLLFVIGSLICALSTVFVPVLIGRVLQGLAMGYIPVAISFAREVTPPSMGNSAVAAISATLGVGGALGLPLSAWIVQEFDWYALFWVSTALAVLVTVLSATMLPHRRPVHTAKLDVVGSIGLPVGILAVLIGVSKGGNWGWGPALTLVAAGLVVLVAWGFYELRHDEPLVDLRVAARRPILLTNIAAILAGFGMMAQAIVVPQLLEMPVETGYGLGQSILAAGLWMAPGGLMMLVFAPVSSKLLTRFGGRITLALGVVVMAGGYVVAFFWMNEPWQLMLASCIASAGVGIGYAAMPMLIMENAPAAEAGAGVGFNSLMRSIGTTSAGAVMAIVLTSQTITAGHGVAVPAQSAFRICFLVGAVAAIAAAVVTLFIRRSRPWGSDGAVSGEATADEPAAAVVDSETVGASR